jgi:type I restriction enzyme S subunit
MCAQPATARADKITQAMLAKAFRGELVPTEAELARQEGRDYEPASAPPRPHPRRTHRQ